MQVKLLMTAKSPLLTGCLSHSHDCWELVLNVCGSGVEQVEEVSGAFSPHAITLYPPGMKHCKYLSPDSPFFQDICIRFEDREGTFPPTPLWLTDDGGGRGEQLFSMILELYHEQGSDSALVQQLFGALCTLLLGRLNGQRKLSPITSALNQYIIQNYTDAACDVNRVFAALGYAPNHIRRVYRQDMQKTPQQYLLSMRLEHAKRLLQMDAAQQYSIGEVAFLSGFDDPNYFSRMFRKVCGDAPSRYKKALGQPRSMITLP